MGHDEGVVTMKTGWHHNNLRSLSVVRERGGERESACCNAETFRLGNVLKD